jgi:chorismate dehydratase
MSYKRDFPSNINKKFKNRRVDAAFISSIESKRYRKNCLDIGIVAKKEIRSVLLKSGCYKPDSHSASSNRLALKLGLEGEVIIGDKALKAYIKDPDNYTDLANQWYERYGLPFVFARLCAHRYGKTLKKLSRSFLNSKTKIPYYVKKRYSLDRDVPINEIDSYLKLVFYNIDKKAKISLKKFLR